MSDPIPDHVDTEDVEECAQLLRVRERRSGNRGESDRAQAYGSGATVLERALHGTAKGVEPVTSEDVIAECAECGDEITLGDWHAVDEDNGDRFCPECSERPTEDFPDG